MLQTEEPVVNLDGVEWGLVIGAIVILVCYLAYAFKTNDWTTSKVWEGADGRASFSKFQFWFWTVAIFYGFIALWIGRMIAEDFFVQPISEVPEDVLAILGISSGTAVLAKGITSQYAARRTNAKASLKANQDKERGAHGERSGNAISQLLTDDSGVPELVKIQMFFFTVAGITFFVLTVIGTALEAELLAELSMPNVDETLVVLMGISSSGYIGKKFVTRDKPKIDTVTPSSVAEDGRIMIMGSGLGSRDSGVFSWDSELLKSQDHKDKSVFEEWTPQLITVNLKELKSKFASLPGDFSGLAPHALDAGKHEIKVIVNDMPNEGSIEVTIEALPTAQDADTNQAGAPTQNDTPPLEGSTAGN